VTRYIIGWLLILVISGCREQRAVQSSTNNSRDSQPMNSSPSPTPSGKSDESPPAQVKVYLNPLAVLLAGAEKQKGQPLTREEVMHVRDTAVFIMMSPDQAEKFYKSLDSQVPIHRMNPDRVWEEWQEIRGQVK
jgi:hypothetical protein